MGKRGPKPTPSVILAGRGSWRGQINPCQPLPMPGAPDMPADVRADPDAAKIWKRIVPRLDDAGVLTIIDGEVLGNYCQLRAMRDRAYSAARKMREMKPEQFPEQSDIGRKVTRQILDITAALRSVESEFGMTPSGRARIVIPSDRSKQHGDKESTAPKTQDFIRFARIN